ncbi:MAG: amidohydrolase family protein, partial [Chloroflexi bacterium]|nr:amidohydrolase family protein [Chloroflexota bacterium]
IHPHSEHVRIARTVGITSQLTKPTGGHISGQSAVINLDGWTADDMLVKERVALHMSIPILPARLTGDDKKEKLEKHKETMREIEDFLDTAKKYAAAKKAAVVDPTIAPDTDLRLEAMVPYVRGEKPVIFSASSYKAILDTIDFAEKHGLRPIISGGAEAWKLADTLKEKEIPVILGTALSYPRGRFEAWDSVYTCASVLDEAGVSWCFASESAAHAYNLGIQAGMAVAHGLDPDRAMYALTLGAATLLGIDEDLGSLEEGKIANVIVTTHPPTQTVSRVTHMFIRGMPIELTSLHTENYVKFRDRPEPVLPPEKELVGPPSFTGK